MSEDRKPQNSSRKGAPILACQGEAGACAFGATRYSPFAGYRPSIARTNDQLVEQLRNKVADRALLSVETAETGQIADDLTLLAESDIAVVGDFFMEKSYHLLVSRQLAESRKIPPLAVRNWILSEQFFPDGPEAPLRPEDQKKLDNQLKWQPVLKPLNLTYADVRRWPHAISGLISEIEEVHSDDQGLRQSHRFVKSHFPDATLIRTTCSGRAAQTIKRCAEGKEDHEVPRQAAIASAETEEIYDLTILQENVHTRQTNNWTRYLVSALKPLSFSQLHEQVADIRAHREMLNEPSGKAPSALRKFLTRVQGYEEPEIAALEATLIEQLFGKGQTGSEVRSLMARQRSLNLLDKAPASMAVLVQELRKRLRDTNATRKDTRNRVRVYLDPHYRDNDLLPALEDMVQRHGELHALGKSTDAVLQALPKLIARAEEAYLYRKPSVFDASFGEIVVGLRALKSALDDQNLPPIKPAKGTDRKTKRLEAMLRRQTHEHKISIRQLCDLDSLVPQFKAHMPYAWITRSSAWLKARVDSTGLFKERAEKRKAAAQAVRDMVASFRRKRLMRGPEQMVHTLLKVTANTADKTTLDLLIPFARANVHICIEQPLPSRGEFGNRTMLLEVVGFPAEFVDEHVGRKRGDDRLKAHVKASLRKRGGWASLPQRWVADGLRRAKAAPADSLLQANNPQNALLDMALKSLKEQADISYLGSFATLGPDAAVSLERRPIYPWEQADLALAKIGDEGGDGAQSAEIIRARKPNRSDGPEAPGMAANLSPDFIPGPADTIH